MREVKNINWNCELPLCSEFEENENYTEENHAVSFEYNGYSLIAQVEFTIYFKWKIQEETRYEPRYVDMTANDVELFILNLYDSEYNDFDLSVKELMDIKEFLKNDLKIQY